MADFILSGFADEIDKDLNLQIQGLKSNGIRYVELRGVNGKSGVDYSVAEMKEIKKVLDDGGIKVSALGSPIGKIKITDPFEPHLDKFKHTLELADVLNTKFIRMFSFFIPKGENPDDFRDEVLERWNGFVAASKGTDFILAHENEKEIYGDTAKRCLDIIESMNCKNVRAVFDPANFVQCKVETYPDAYMILKPYISYMHIKDALFADGNVVPAGYGDGKVKEILEDLNKSISGEMFLSLEPHLGSFEGFDKLETSKKAVPVEQSGLGKFKIAADALKSILKDLKISFN